MTFPVQLCPTCFTADRSQQFIPKGLHCVVYRVAVRLFDLAVYIILKAIRHSPHADDSIGSRYFYLDRLN